MEFAKLLAARRSIRTFDGTKKVTSAQLEQILAAAQEAPSWKNTETGRYYCVTSEEVLTQLAANCLPSFNANSSKGAALLVATFAANRAGFDKTTGKADNEVGNGWGYYDLGLQNALLILKARELGLDTLIMGIRDEAQLRHLLHIPAEELLGPVIAVGYRAKDPLKPPRKALAEIAKFY